MCFPLVANEEVVVPLPASTLYQRHSHSVTLWFRDLDTQGENLPSPRCNMSMKGFSDVDLGWW